MMIDLFNTAAAGVLSAVAAWAVMSPSVRCGLLAHVGLALISFGFFGVFLMGFQGYTFTGAIAAAHAFVHLGLVLCVIGYMRRSRRQPRRRASDWMRL